MDISSDCCNHVILYKFKKNVQICKCGISVNLLGITDDHAKTCCGKFGNSWKVLVTLPFSIY